MEVPHAYLRLDGHSRSTTLYLPQRDLKQERSEGPQLNSSDPETAVRVTGVDYVKSLEELGSDLFTANCIYIPMAPAEGREACRDTLLHAMHLRDTDPWDRRPSTEKLFHEKLAAICCNATFLDLSPILDQLRLIKSPTKLR